LRQKVQDECDDEEADKADDEEAFDVLAAINVSIA
jgi:hypothetical protein